MSRKRPAVDPDAQVKAIFLGRLARLIRLYREYCGEKPDLNALGVRMLERAIDATYRDCIDYGVADAAGPIMAAHRRAAWRGETPEA